MEWLFLKRRNFVARARGTLGGPLPYVVQEFGLWSRNWNSAVARLPAPQHQRSAHVFHNLVDTSIAVLLGIFEQFAQLLVTTAFPHHWH